MKYDPQKLADLQRRLADQTASIRGLSQEYHLIRHERDQSILMFSVGLNCTHLWQSGQDTSVFLNLPADKAAAYPAELAQARAIADKGTAAADLMNHINAQRARIDALAQLVRGCEQYVQQQAQEA